MSLPVWGVRAVESDIGIDAFVAFKEYCRGRDRISVASFLEHARTTPPPAYRSPGSERLYHEVLAVLCAELLLELWENGCIRYMVILDNEREDPRVVEGIGPACEDIPSVREALLEARSENGALYGLWQRHDNGEQLDAWRAHVSSLLARLDAARI